MYIPSQIKSTQIKQIFYKKSGLSFKRERLLLISDLLKTNKVNRTLRPGFMVTDERTKLVFFSINDYIPASSTVPSTLSFALTHSVNEKFTKSLSVNPTAIFDFPFFLLFFLY